MGSKCNSFILNTFPRLNNFAHNCTTVSSNSFSNCKIETDWLFIPNWILSWKLYNKSGLLPNPISLRAKLSSYRDNITEIDL